MDRLGEWDPPQSWHRAESGIMNLALKSYCSERERKKVEGKCSEVGRGGQGRGGGYLQNHTMPTFLCL